MPKSRANAGTKPAKPPQAVIETANRKIASLKAECNQLKEVIADQLDFIEELHQTIQGLEQPISLRLECPMCRYPHVDEGEWAIKRHHTHACQQCGNVWRPAVVETVGVRFLPGFKNKTEQEAI